MVIKLNGKNLRIPEDLHLVEELELRNFLYEWSDGHAYVIGHTSGSTGVPKEIRLSKEDMRASARITNAFFGIDKESLLLLCLSVSYIAGKMMVIRALESGAELWSIKVSSHPFKELIDTQGMDWNEIKNAKRRVDLAAMVPLQVEETLKVAEEKAILATVRQLLVGGAPVLPQLEQQLQGLPVHCYATYGMTETVSHVALRRMTGQPEYIAVGGVEFSTDQRGCLVIDAPHLETKKFVTNDLVKLIDTRRFEWLGRYDHVINSGGIKFFPEVIESKIGSYISRRFFITSLPDERLGQRIILVLEGEQLDDYRENCLMSNLRQVLTSYEMPKGIIYLSCFQETQSGKVIRTIGK